MGKTLKIYIVFLFLLIAGIVYLDAIAPRPINWTPTYDFKDKIPFGLYVFDKESKTLFKNQKIEKINVTAYEFLKDKTFLKSLDNEIEIKGTILNIAEYSDIDKKSIESICEFVSNGNTLFLSAKELPIDLLDTLKIKTKSEYKYADSIFNWIANPKLGSEKYKITEGLGNNYFSEIDTLKTTILGYQTGDSIRANFIKVKFNNGQIFLHTQPTAFTNFHLLKGNHYQYAQKIVSYIPKDNLFFLAKNQGGEIVSQSPMRFILSQPALKWAWWLFLLGTLVFMIFNVKRKQRVVPIIKPLENTTVDFVKTIGNLYFQEGNHGTIIDKKIVYFLEKIRNEYLLDTSKLDDDFIKKLHQKSGKNLEDIKRVIYLINNHRKSRHESVEGDLIEINKAIEKIIH